MGGEAGRPVVSVSLDHDLGVDTGCDVARYITRHAATVGPFPWDAHATKPAQKQKIVEAMQEAEWAWKALRPAMPPR